MFGYFLLTFILGAITGAVALWLIKPKTIVEVETPVEVEKTIYVTKDELVGSESFVPANNEE